MTIKKTLFVFLPLFLMMSVNLAYAQTIIECTVSYAYADKKSAIREQVWEDEWVWNIESEDDFQIAKATSTSVLIQSPKSQPQGKCIITLRNKYGQQHQTKLDMENAKRDKGDRVFVTLLKAYNKVILENRAGVEVSGDVYFGPSGPGASVLEDSSDYIKCPPASGGGYSFPNILKKQKRDYSVYIIDSKGDCTEMVFSERRWYGNPIIEFIKIN